MDSGPDAERFHRASDVFVLTSRDDSFPFVVPEAMACRLPVVTFVGSGGSVEAVGENTGRVAPCLSIEAMADAVIDLLENPENRQTMVRLAEQHVRSTFRFGGYAEGLPALAQLKGAESATLRP